MASPTTLKRRFTPPPGLDDGALEVLEPLSPRGSSPRSVSGSPQLPAVALPAELDRPAIRRRLSQDSDCSSAPSRRGSVSSTASGGVGLSLSTSLSRTSSASGEPFGLVRRLGNGGPSAPVSPVVGTRARRGSAVSPGDSRERRNGHAVRPRLASTRLTAQPTRSAPTLPFTSPTSAASSLDSTTSTASMSMFIPSSRTSPFASPASSIAGGFPGLVSPSRKPALAPVHEPVASTSRAPPPPVLSLVDTAETEAGPATAGLRARRMLNKKSLSLAVPAPGLSSAGSRSCPPSPLLIDTSAPARDLSAPPPTAGMVSMRPDAGSSDLYRGGMEMRRRQSLPRLRLGGVGGGPKTGLSLKIDTAGPRDGDAVRMLGHGKERLGYDEIDDYPYEKGPRLIVPGIYLGSELNANDPAMLAQFGIGYVLNVAKEVRCPWTATAAPTGRNSVILEADEDADADSIETLHPSAMLPVPLVDDAMLVDEPPRRTTHLRPSLMRTALSTPNLHTSFQSSAATDDATGEGGLPSGATRTTFEADATTGRPSIEYLKMPWGHDQDSLVTKQFPTAFAFLDEARSRGVNALVHCQCGVSRSATVAIGYVMRQASQGATSPAPSISAFGAANGRGEGDEPAMTLERIRGMHDAYSFVKDRSSFIAPNINLLCVRRSVEPR